VKGGFSGPAVAGGACCHGLCSRLGEQRNGARSGIRSGVRTPAVEARVAGELHGLGAHLCDRAACYSNSGWGPRYALGAMGALVCLNVKDGACSGAGTT
jgi:hypothetical protein